MQKPSEEPVSIDGYYPLYKDKKSSNAASPKNSSHTHKFDGTTYYMPDGVTKYHGDYKSSKKVKLKSAMKF